MDDEVTIVRLAGEIVQGRAIRPAASEAMVAVPSAKLDSDDIVFRVADKALKSFGIARGDLLIVEPRADGSAATAELVLAVIRDQAFVGRWWTKRGRRALLDAALAPLAEEPDLRVIGAITVIVRTDVST